MCPVERDPTLVIVVPGEQETLLAGRWRIGRKPTQLIAARTFDLEHVSTEVGEQLPAVGTHSAAEVEHPNARQRQRIATFVTPIHELFEADALLGVPFLSRYVLMALASSSGCSTAIA